MLMEIYRVSFAGHRELYGIRDIEDRIESLARELLRTKDYVEFYMGRSGDFDISSASAIKRAQNGLDSRNSSLILVLPHSVKDQEYYESFYDEILLPIDANIHFKASITKRNEWLVDKTDLLVAYVEHPHGGAYKTLKYAEKLGIKIINLADCIKQS